MEYRKRIADELLELQLEAAGIVLNDGAKWCGKTTTALQRAESVVYMDDPEHKSDYKRLAETDIRILLEGANPRLIDEWQKTPHVEFGDRFSIPLSTLLHPKKTSDLSQQIATRFCSSASFRHFSM